MLLPAIVDGIVNNHVLRASILLPSTSGILLAGVLARNRTAIPPEFAPYRKISR